MGLRIIKPRIGRLKPAIARRTDAHGHVETSQPRRWYKLKAWGELRQRVFLRDKRICQLQACQDPRPLLRPIADHKMPHRGDRSAFFCEANVWTLCKPCHDQVKQREEAAERRRGGYT